MLISETYVVLSENLFLRTRLTQILMYDIIIDMYLNN